MTQFFLYTVGRLSSRESAGKAPLNGRCIRFSLASSQNTRNGVPSGFLMMMPVVAGPLVAFRAVCSFFVAFSASGLETGLQRLWCSIMRLLASNRVRGEFW